MLEAEARARQPIDLQPLPFSKAFAVASQKVIATPPLTPEQQAERQRRFEDGERRRERERRDAILHRVFGNRTRYAGCRLGNFVATNQDQRDAISKLTEYGKEMPARIAEGQSIVFFGPPGTGKDHLMASMLNGAVLVHNRSVAWRNGMDLYGDFRDRMNDENAPSERRMIEQLASPDILAISDPAHPFEPLTSYQAATLFRVIDARYSACKPTWVTLNVADSSDAEKRLGVQVMDRLRHGALFVPCFWPSFRKGGK